MKKLLFFCSLIIGGLLCKAQTEADAFKRKQLSNALLENREQSQQFRPVDFSELWTTTENQYVYGFIGDKYERIRIKFILIKKIPSTNSYTVYGKSMVKTNICDFKGTLNVTNIRKVKNTSNGVDNELKGKGIKGQYIILGDYEFAETKGQAHSGRFKGSFNTSFYLDKDNVAQYDNIDLNSDGFTNNEFVGKWTMYNSNFIQRCNWGDYRIPNSGDLDIGAGEFSPADKYLTMGWQNLYNAYADKSPNKKTALKIEQANWWKL